MRNVYEALAHKGERTRSPGEHDRQAASANEESTKHICMNYAGVVTSIPRDRTVTFAAHRIWRLGKQ